MKLLVTTLAAVVLAAAVHADADDDARAALALARARAALLEPTPKPKTQAAAVLTYADAYRRAQSKGAPFILAIGEAPRPSFEFYGSPVYVCPDAPTGTTPGHYQVYGSGQGSPVWWTPGFETPVSMPVPPAAARAAPATPRWYTLADYAAAKAAAEASDRPALMYFTDPVNCVYCRKLEATDLAAADVQKTLAGLTCISIDVTTPDGAAMAAAVGATTWPTVIAFRNGTEFDRGVGLTGAARLLHALAAPAPRPAAAPPGPRHAGGGYNASHTCPSCGASQYVIAGYNADGSHNHTCGRCGTTWYHGGPVPTVVRTGGG